MQIYAVLWWPFWKWWPVEKFLCRESIRDIIIYPHMKWHWNRIMLNFCGIVATIFKMATGRNFSMSGINSGHHYLPTISTSWIDSRHWKISNGLHFQNGHHNTAKIQHCSISKVAFNLFFKPVVSGRFGRLQKLSTLMYEISTFP
jgi:hypothetical protein